MPVFQPLLIFQSYISVMSGTAGSNEKEWLSRIWNALIITFFLLTIITSVLRHMHTVSFSLYLCLSFIYRVSLAKLTGFARGSRVNIPP